MSNANHRDSRNTLSIVVASYNSALWLPSTLESLRIALARATWEAEVVVVDDGSTDNTQAVLSELQRDFPVPLRVIRQENKGRFLARWEGTQAARFETVLLLDSRLITHERALDYLQRTMTAEPAAAVWNGHVITDPTAPLIGHFWSVPTYLFWGGYLSHPRLSLITTKTFDRFPKGTGFLVVPKELFKKACIHAWPDRNARLASDDTKLLRFIAAETPIRLDPEFSATYRPRASVAQFLSHSWDRGTLFVDSYAGTSALRNVILFILAIAPPLVLLALIGFAAAALWAWGIMLGALVIASIGAPAVIAALRHCAPRAILSYLAFVVPFGATFWAGLVRGLFVHRRSFTRNASQKEGAIL